MTKNLFVVGNVHVYDRHKRFVCVCVSAILLRVWFAAVINLLQTLGNVLLLLSQTNLN